MLGALEFGQKGAFPGARRGIFGAQAYAMIDSEVRNVFMVVSHCRCFEAQIGEEIYQEADSTTSTEKS